MNRMQEYLVRAADELGIRVEVAYPIILSDGRKLISQARFPDLGNASGTLVFCSSDNVDVNARRELKAHGCGISTFSEPLPNEVFDAGNYAEMFAEWGWTGELTSKPSWIP